MGGNFCWRLHDLGNGGATTSGQAAAGAEAHEAEIPEALLNPINSTSWRRQAMGVIITYRMKIRKYLSGTAKRSGRRSVRGQEVRHPSPGTTFTSISKTEDGEKLWELWVPWMLGEEIGRSETPLPGPGG